jgi:hypothetical protein
MPYQWKLKLDRLGKTRLTQAGIRGVNHNLSMPAPFSLPILQFANHAITQSPNQLALNMVIP